MKIEKRIKPSFSIIGKEGSTLDGEGFIQKLWEDANSHFNEVQSLAMKDENGNLVGIWGAMSDYIHSFKPWEENFSKGLYLAGIECVDDAEAPEGWTKWTIPAYEYLCAEVESESTFSAVLDYINTNSIALVGAVHDFTCPSDGKNYMFFIIILDCQIACLEKQRDGSAYDILHTVQVICCHYDTIRQCCHIERCLFHHIDQQSGRACLKPVFSELLCIKSVQDTEWIVHSIAAFTEVVSVIHPFQLCITLFVSNRMC